LFTPKNKSILSQNFKIYNTMIINSDMTKSITDFTNLFNTIGQGMVYQDNQGKLISINNSALQIFGIAVNKTTDHTWADLPLRFIQEDGSDFTFQQFPPTVALKTGKSITDVVLKVIPSGTNKNIWIKMNAHPVVMVNENTTLGVLSIFSDISENHESFLQLKQSEEKFRLMAKNSIDTIYTLDTNLKFTYLSPSIEKMVGVKPEDWIGTRISEHTNWLEFLKMSRIALKMIRNYKTFEYITFESQMYNNKGELIPLEISGKPLINKGRLIGIQGSARDITERKNSEKTLRENELKLRRITDNITDIVWTSDLKLNLTYISPSVQRVLGYSPSTFIKLRVEERYPLPSVAKILAVLNSELKNGNKQGIDKGRSHIIEIDHYKSDGNIICCEMNMKLIKDEKGNPVGLQGVTRDVTERKRVENDLIRAKEKAQESDKLKTAFIQNITHEIRTPLNGILGFGQFLIDQTLSEDEKQEYYKIMERSCKRLVQTVSDYVDISKLTTGSMEINQGQFLLNAFLDELLNYCQELCANKDIQVELDVPPDTNHLMIFSDIELLRKALIHLLNNAEKFTKKGRIVLGYSIKNELIEFFVSDTGKGISQDKVPVIFDSFMQEDISLTRNYEGSGLGLSIAKGIINLLGGKLWVESSSGMGSVFFFTIPNDLFKETSKFVMEETKTINENNLPVSLIAEDSETNYLYLKFILEKEGYSTLYAENGERAVELCKNHPEISVVLMDIKMPVMNGIEAMSIIKKIRKDLPVIAVTAYANSGENHLMYEAGCVDIIPKPINKSTLIQKLSTINAFARHTN